ncbi:MAG: phosphomannomutase, partial [Alishewanella sp.]|nr:phosphomannomutase [Alishewanella sp.]
MTTALSQIIKDSGIAFGTSGARGLVTQFTPEVCAAFTQSFLQLMQQGFSFNAIALGIDNRPSSPDIAASCAGIAKAMGFAVHYYGVLPTPALALQAMADGMPAIMVTGSHIPFDRNGIKFYRPDGEISKADEQQILSQSNSLNAFSPLPMPVEGRAANTYLQRYLDMCSPQLFAGKHIGIYEHSSSGRELYHQLFSQLGAKVTRLEATEHFVPIDTEAVSNEDQQKAWRWSAQYGFDAIFSTDGDGDRPLIADETGTWLRGDTVGLLCAKALNIQALAVPVNANSAIDLTGAFNKVLRTRIGSPYVIAGMQQLVGVYPSVGGFEANGGFLLATDLQLNGNTLKALPTRDALLPFIAILQQAGKQPLSQLTQALPQRFTASQRVQHIAAAMSQPLLAEAAAEPQALLKRLGNTQMMVEAVDVTDGVRLTLQDETIVHLRASGNAPELRIYTEAASQEQAEQLANRLQQQLQNW